MRFAEAADGEQVLLVTNSNPYQLFDAGSLLAIPWSSLDLASSRNPTADLDAHALELPSYSAGLALQDDLGLVTVRLSEDARTREENDEVHLVDLSALPLLSESDRGTDGGNTVQVGPDPVDVVVDPSSGLAFVANRTAHSISVLDLSGDEVAVIHPWEEYALSSAEFDDVDLSGSRGNLAKLEATDSTLVPDDHWSMEWIAGTWRLWLPSDEGISRSQTTGNGSWTPSSIGVELEVDDADGLIDSITDPAWASGRLFFADGGDIHSAISGSWLGDWEMEYIDLFRGREGKWDEEIGAPAVTFDEEGVWLFYEGTDGESQGIGAAFSEDGYDFIRESDPVLEPIWDHELAGIGDPYIVFDSELDLWRMFYSATDGERWTIGHATSPDLLVWESDEQPMVQIEDGDIAAPVISRTVGDWKLWASVRTEGTWQVIEAASVDGLNWLLGAPIEGLEFDSSVAFQEEPPVSPWTPIRPMPSESKAKTGACCATWPVPASLLRA
jgi:hypothetical protein